MEPHQIDPSPSELSTPDSRHIRARKRRERSLRWSRVLIAVLGVSVCLLAWSGYETRKSQDALRTELAKRFAEGDSVAREAHTLARQSKEAIDQIQARLGAIDARQLEAQGQFAALESMYVEFSRARDERTLAEVEQALNIAEQHLQLAGNVPAALTALQAADNRLAGMDQARYLPLRKQIASDIERLRTLPLADVTSMALQLETLIGRISSLPLAFERTIPTEKSRSAAVAHQAKPVKGAAKKNAKPQPEPVQSAASVPPSPSVVARFFSDMWDDFRELVRIERLDSTDQSLLAPNQAIYLRENLRLRLLSARLALLQRDGRLFSEDIHQAITWLNRHFDTKAKPVADLIADLHKIETAQLSMALPTLSEANAALRGLKLGNGKR